MHHFSQSPGMTVCSPWLDPSCSLQTLWQWHLPPPHSSHLSLPVTTTHPSLSAHPASTIPSLLSAPWATHALPPGSKNSFIRAALPLPPHNSHKWAADVLVSWILQRGEEKDSKSRSNHHEGLCALIRYVINRSEGTLKENIYVSLQVVLWDITELWKYSTYWYISWDLS